MPSFLGFWCFREMPLPAAVQARLLEDPPNFARHTVSIARAIQWWWMVWVQVRSDSWIAFTAWFGTIFVTGAALYLVHPTGGNLFAGDGAGGFIAEALGASALLLMIFLYVGIKAMVTATARVKSLGEWQANRFIFHQPVHLGTSLAEAKDSKKMWIVTARDAPKFSVIHCELEIPAISHLLRATVQSAYCYFQNWESMVGNAPWPTFAKGPLHCAVRINGKRQFFVEWLLPEQAIPHELRIKMTSFEIQDATQRDGFKFYHWRVSQPDNKFDVYARGNPRNPS